MYIQLDLAPQIDRLSLVDHRACAPEHLELLEAAIYGLEIAVQAASAALATLALPATPQQQQPARADADHDRLLGELSAGLGRLSVSGAQAAAMRKSSFPATTPTPLLAVTSTRRWSDVGRVVPECFPGRIGASGRRSSIRHRTPPRPLQPRSPARSLSPARGSSPLRNLSPLRDISPSPRTLDLSPSPRIRSGIGAPARRRRRQISVLVDSSSSSSASSSDSLLADMDQETPGSPVAKIRRTSAAFPSPSPKTWEAPTGPSIFAVPAAATWPPKAEVVMLSSSEEEVALVEGAAGPIPGRNFGDSDSQWTAAGGDSQVAARRRPRRINQRVARVRELLRMPSRSRFGGHQVCTTSSSESEVELSGSGSERLESDDDDDPLGFFVVPDDSDSGSDSSAGRRLNPPSKDSTPPPPPGPPRPEMSARQYARQRSALTAAAYTDFNQRAFGSKLPVDLVIAWNKRLNTTAGRTWPTRYPPGHASIPTLNRPVSAADGYVYDARIELSAKVLDTPAKLERTLLHEMCHVAAWLLDHTSRPPHGDVFWKYARAATDAVPHLAVSTRHTYAIAYKFTYVCSQCGHKYGRHSKSIDTATRRCGACQDGQLVLDGGTGAAGGGGGSRRPATPSAYQLFVKENYALVRQESAVQTPGEVMKRLGLMWRARGTGAAREN